MLPSHLPLSLAVRAGNVLHVSGTPGFDENRRIAHGDFAAQMRHAMDNVGQILREGGADWTCVVHTRIWLVRREDFAEMNAIYATYFRDGRYPARTTAIVAALPQPAFLVEVECEAVLDSAQISHMLSIRHI